MKSKKAMVDNKIRVGGSATIPHGNKSGGMGPDHSMSEGVHHIGHVPADAGKFDRDHSSKRDEK